MWRQSCTSDKMLLMATFVPDLSSDDAIQKMDQWKLRKLKADINVVDQDGWTMLSTRRRGTGSINADTADDNEEDDEVDTRIFYDGENEPDDDFDMMQDDYDYDGEFKTKYQKRKTHEELANSWIKRSVEFRVNEQLLDLFDRCSRQSSDSLTVKEKSNLVKGWEAMLKMDANANLWRLTAEYDAAAEIVNEFEADMDATALRRADVIGMTTNGAAKYNRYSLLCAHFFLE